MFSLIFEHVTCDQKWLNGEPDLYFCAGSVLFKTKGVTPGGEVEIALDNKHQGNIVYLMHY